MHRAVEVVDARCDRVGQVQLENVLLVGLKAEKPAVVVGLRPVEGSEFLGRARGSILRDLALLDQAGLGDGLVDRVAVSSSAGSSVTGCPRWGWLASHPYNRGSEHSAAK